MSMSKNVDRGAQIVVGTICIIVIILGVVAIGKFLVDGGDMTMPMEGPGFVVCALGAVLLIAFVMFTPVGRGIGITLLAIAIGYGLYRTVAPIYRYICSFPDSPVR